MKAEVVIVGGGLAGLAAAIGSARAGRDVLLIERAAAAHHKVCGEFLSAEALGYLRGLGVDVAELGAVTLRGVRFAGGGDVSCAELPFAAMSLTRRRLDEELMEVAERAGVRVLRGRRVETIERSGGLWQAFTSGGEIVAGSALFLATGKHDVRQRARVQGRSCGVQSDLVAFKMYFRLTPQQARELEGNVELVVYRGGYGGLQPVEDGAVNLCCLVEREQLKKLGGRWEDLLEEMKLQCHQLRDRLHGAEPLLEKPLAISAIPYGYLRERSEEGLWALGDQAAVIPSFTGDGMSMALHSGCLAATMYLRGQSTADYQRVLRGDVRQQVAIATAISRGLVWGPTQNLCVAAVRRWPSLLPFVARRTRIRESAMRGLEEAPFVMPL